MRYDAPYWPTELQKQCWSAAAAVQRLLVVVALYMRNSRPQQRQRPAINTKCGA
jgi:hypothetical protein